MHAAGSSASSGGLCLDCRTLLADRVCEDGHETVSLHDAAGRARLLAAVWQPGAQPAVQRVTALQPWRRRYAWAFRLAALGLGATIAGCLSFTLCSDHPFEALVAGGTWLFIAILATLVVPALLYEGWESHAGERGATTVVERSAGYAPAAGPHGVAAQPLRSGGLVGTVSGALLRAPISERSCNAWAVWLEHRGAILLRASEGAELYLQLDDGRRLTVPAGRRRWDERGLRRAVPLADARAWLTRCGVPAATEREDAFPATRAWEATLSPGDRVELFGDVAQRPVSTEAAGSYRDAPEQQLVALGVPLLRVP